MRCCFIVCDHGFGHTKRVASVCRELERRTGNPPTVLANAEHSHRFGMNAIHFQTGTTREALVRGDAVACRWHEHLPELEAFDVVVCDNLPEVLEIRDDALLMGSFLWHQVIDGIDSAYRKNAERLLERYEPFMLGSGLFASRELRASTRFVDVGLFHDDVLPKNRKTDLLISCGANNSSVDEARAAVRYMLSASVNPFRVVHVEPRLLPDKRPDWMVSAVYSTDMYSRVASAVIRPGIGTITELLFTGASIFCFYESGNGELRYNAEQLVRYGYGTDCRTAERAVRAALESGLGESEEREADPALRFDGARLAAGYIASYQPGSANRS